MSVIRNLNANILESAFLKAAMIQNNGLWARLTLYTNSLIVNERAFNFLSLIFFSRELSFNYSTQNNIYWSCLLIRIILVTFETPVLLRDCFEMVTEVISVSLVFGNRNTAKNDLDCDSKLFVCLQSSYRVVGGRDVTYQGDISITIFEISQTGNTRFVSVAIVSLWIHHC